MLFRYDRMRKFSAAMVACCFFATFANAQKAAPPTPGNDDFDPIPTQEEVKLNNLPEVKKWKTELSRHIARFVKYPPAQHLSGAKGETLVSFRITRGGQVLKARITKSSGVPAFDEAAIQAIRAANPFPAAPSIFTAQEANFTAPLNFRSNMSGAGPDHAPRFTTYAVIDIKAPVSGKALPPPLERSLAAQIKQCVFTPARESYSFKLRLDRDGSISEPPISEDKSDYGRLATTSTASDLMKCKPFKLEADFYDLWRDIIVTHSPGPPEIIATHEQKKPANQ